MSRFSSMLKTKLIPAVCNVPRMSKNRYLSSQLFVNRRFTKEETQNGRPIQESDLYKPALLDCSRWGLNYGYQKYFCDTATPDLYKNTKTKKPRNIIVIGAGLSGLSAGYELAQAGHNVKIIEMQHRIGGRVKTISDSHFHPGLWAESGAMRVPGTGEPDWTGPCHYLTDFYINKFNLPRIPFINTTRGYHQYYDQRPIKFSEWKKNPRKYCDHFWPGWDKRLREVEQSKPGFKAEHMGIHDIDSYFDKTVEPMVNQLRSWLLIDQKAAWDEWVKKWSFFSIEQFLRSSYDSVKLALDRHNTSSKFPVDEAKLETLADLLPWPLEAINAYSAYTYILPLQLSLIEYLRDSHLGLWWKDPMYTLRDGLRMLPEAFIKENHSGWNKDVELSKDIVPGAKVHKIEYDVSDSSVKVVCHNTTTQQEHVFSGDSVVVAVPINLIRGIKFCPPLPEEYYHAFENMNTISGTKIILQCRTQFWREEGIKGGFSKTNRPIGQIHYQSSPDLDKGGRGIIVCYAWKSEALLFGSYSEEDAIAEAVEQIAEIHPQIRNEFEVGAIQPWYNDPAAQGCSTFLQPEEYLSMRRLMDHPHHPIYFAGEGVSFTNGWMQGALESGVRAACLLFAKHEDAVNDAYKVNSNQ